MSTKFVEKQRKTKLGKYQTTKNREVNRARVDTKSPPAMKKQCQVSTDCSKGKFSNNFPMCIIPVILPGLGLASVTFRVR